MALKTLIPAIIGKDWWEAWEYPSQIMDQNFAVPLPEEDLESPRSYSEFLVRSRTQACADASGKSEVKNDPKQFQITLEVEQFKQDELVVSIKDDCIIICGNHEERRDQQGYVAREFSRSYILPPDCKIDAVSASLSPDGKLTVVAPKEIPIMP
ncbi:alpha-crystallin B chain [Trichonephila clavata]|uniref:Alpha-crystallin B chain n=1 Tax=Trichonephila clavata TaxID=2740835 RepID=A0A8X6FXA9_TRICU|nr:alpha-crystallin B chain [Trichonephila clavata]